MLVSQHHAVNPGHLPRRHEQSMTLKSRNSKRLSRNRSNQSPRRGNTSLYIISYRLNVLLIRVFVQLNRDIIDS